ncbi:MAG: hypothetical protein ACOYD4_03935 [Solirubrobacterales bacterium]
MAFLKYGLDWPDDYDAAQIERKILQSGGRIHGFGNGLLFHFQAYAHCLWPEDSETRWTELIYREILSNQFSSVIGPGSSWKSGTVARLSLMDWSLFPESTYIIVSSTNIDGLRARIFGEISKLWGRAHDRFDWFPGNVVDHRCAITQENTRDDSVRDMRNAIIGVPCVSSSGKFLGMGKFAGRKNRRVWCISDEFQFMERSILDAQENLISNGDNLLPGLYPPDYMDVTERGRPIRGYKCVFIGNPNNTRPENPLHVVSEPPRGWASLPDDGKTKCWDAKQVAGSVVKCRVVNLDGRDSPNNDFPTVNGRPKWPHLVSNKRIQQYAKDSDGFWSQGVGVVRMGLSGLKIVTKELCEQFHAYDDVLWRGENPNIKIGALDAAYGGVGGDRCVLMHGEFGESVDGIARLLIYPHIIVPVKSNPKKSPEDQIAQFSKDQMEAIGVKPENFFFDARGGCAMAFARIWSSQVNVIEFGGRPTDREVGQGVDSMIEDENGNMRAKKAFEFYSKLVTELWWSTRLCIEADQLRGMTDEVIYDGQPREWYKVGGDKIEIEPKREMKKRTGESPDIFDTLVVLLEGARRRGFRIRQPGDRPEMPLARRYDWLQEMAQQRTGIRKAHILQRV